MPIFVLQSGNRIPREKHLTALNVTVPTKTLTLAVDPQKNPQKTTT